MDKLELFRACWDFEKTDRFPLFEHGFWPETYTRWQSEGLPEGVALPSFTGYKGRDLFEHFGIIKPGYITPYIFMVPPLEHKVIEDTADYYVVRNGSGAVIKHSKTVQTLPQEIDYAIKSEKDYHKYRERLTAPALEQRVGAYIKNDIEEYRGKEDYAAVCTHMHGFFAYPREILGVVNSLMMFYDEPDFIKLLFKDRVELYKAVYAPVFEKIKVDFAFIWEDMCFKNGPLVSPELFREFLLPAYKELVGFMNDCGVKRIVVDSDGDVTKLLPLWMEAGVNAALPFEVQSGMDVVKIGEDFPKLTIIGGINKYELFKTKADIDAELNRVLPAMAKRGGYIPTLDHWVPPEISLDNFEYYLDKLSNFKF